MKEKHPAELLIDAILNIYPEFDFSFYSMSKNQSYQRLLNTKQACCYLGNISKMQLWRLVNVSHVITPVRITDTKWVMYDKSDLDRLISEKKVKKAKMKNGQLLS